jgi:hypothetical protein
VSNKQNTSLHWDDEIYHRLVSLKIWYRLRWITYGNITVRQRLIASSSVCLLVGNGRSIHLLVFSSFKIQSCFVGYWKRGEMLNFLWLVPLLCVSKGDQGDVEVRRDAANFDVDVSKILSIYMYLF